MRSEMLLFGMLACGNPDSSKEQHEGTRSGTVVGVAGGTPGATPGGSVSTPSTVDCPATTTGPQLETTTGCYLGRVADGAEGFLGIDYAESPLGPLRWARPQPIAPRLDPISAVELGSPCPQTNGTVDLELGPGEGDEDCLSLNVIRPEGTVAGAGLPILFFVHGGSHLDGHGGSEGMIGGSFNRSTSDPPLVASAPRVVTEEQTIVVTVNYRLGQLGWLALPGLSDESGDGASGNQGLWDVLVALQWVNDNAEALGGDAGQLMLFGESAGSVSVCSLLTAPRAEGLFTSVLLQSGGCEHVTTPLTGDTFLVDSAETLGQSLATELGCNAAGDDAAVLDCMRGKSQTEVLAALPGSIGIDFTSAFWGPIVDGVLLPEPPADRIASGGIANVPVGIGVNADEGTLFTTLQPISSEQTFDDLLALVAAVLNWDATGLQELYDPDTRYGGDVGAAYDAFYGDAFFVCPGRTLAENLQAHTSVYPYWWTHEYFLTSFLGAHHGVEIVYAFGTVGELGDDATMADIATSTWASVARGSPAIPGVGPWATHPTWTELSIAPGPLGAFPRQEQCDWMDAQPGW